MTPHDGQPEVTEILGARCAVPNEDPEMKWDFALAQGKIQSCEKHKPLPPGFPVQEKNSVLDARGKFLSPSLCHPHVHLDKCFLLSDPKYRHLTIETGTFEEAMQLTAKAKAMFQKDDLLRRGHWLVRESIDAGVTCMRAFVEVDTIVRLKCLDVGLKLKEEFRERCHIQICAFAQEALFTGDDAEEGRMLIEQALQRPGVDVLGTTPYVEDERAGANMKNIEWAFRMAVQYEKHIDFHLDYHLDAGKAPRMFDVLQAARECSFNDMVGKTIVMGHCTRLTMVTEEEMSTLAKTVRDLPVHFVGLPTSDLYMMDRNKRSDDETPFSRRRGTLPVGTLRNKYNINAVLGINNVGNAFTPHGNCDPMSLACLGVGLYQDGTGSALTNLYDAVSESAKAAIGLPASRSVHSTASWSGIPANLILFGRGTPKESEDVRVCKTLQDVVGDPPYHRITVYNGHVVGSRS